MPLAESPALPAPVRTAFTVNPLVPADAAAVVVRVRVAVFCVPAGDDAAHLSEAWENLAVTPAGSPDTRNFVVSPRLVLLATTTSKETEPALPSVRPPD